MTTGYFGISLSRLNPGIGNDMVNKCWDIHILALLAPGLGKMKISRNSLSRKSAYLGIGLGAMR